MKKSLCIILSLILIFSAPAGAVASAASGCNCGKSPVVFVRGFGANLYLNPESENPEMVFPPSSDAVKAAVPDIISAVNALLITKDNDKFMDSIIAVMYSLMGHIECDDNGNSAENVGAICPLPTVDTHKNRTYSFDANADVECGEFEFEYDWRIDPMEVAADLNEYINAVCDLTGHSKVILCSHSDGNSITAAYLSEFGDAKLEKLIFLSAAFQGLDMVGHLYTKDVSIEGNEQALLDFLDTFLGGEPSGDLLNALIGMLDDAGVIDKLVPLLDGVLDEELDRLYDDLLLDLYGTMPGVWNFVPDAFYENAKTIMLEGDAKYASLVEKTDDYHYNVQCKVKQLLTRAKADGVPVAICTGYGISPIPIYQNCNEQCDMLIDTKNASIGATCAKIGTTLADTSGAFCSPDGMIDASTCLFPENTWFIKYQDHNDFCAPYREFLTWLVEHDGQPTVTENEDYPQFMVCADNHAKLVSVNDEPERETYSNNFIKFFVNLFRVIMMSFAK